MTQQIELLAPAGSWDAFVAAVENGADAVYLGGTLFSARKYASNFELAAIKEACDYAHLRGAKVYVTVNTLIDEGEFIAAAEFISRLHNIGVDAVIVQDIGLMHLIIKLIPGMPVHASTQMAIFNSFGVQHLKEIGLERVVLARELSLENISLIHQKVPEAELEVFSHGALCVSYSGQCLMSSLIGGRSGNRGACAQPCRLTYQLVDAAGNTAAVAEVGEHLLSPKDLYTLELLPDLVEAGVKSLKIEGRMKRPEYVATVVANYRQALDMLDSDEHYLIKSEQEQELKQIFNRDFTNAFLKGNPGKDYISFNRPNNRGLLLGRVQNYNSASKQALIKLEIPLAVGDGIEIWVSQGGRVATSVGRILLGKHQVDEAVPGQAVLIDLPKRVNPGDRVFKNHDHKLMTKAQESYKDNKKRLIPLIFNAKAAIGEPLRLTAKDELGNLVEIKSDFIGERAEKRPLAEEVLRNQLDRLGNTAFKIEELTFDIEPGVMIPMSVINQVRREAIEALEARRLETYRRNKIDIGQVMYEVKQLSKNESSNKPSKKDSVMPSLAVHVGNSNSVEAALNEGIDVVYLGGEDYRSGQRFTKDELISALRKCREHRVAAILVLPRIIHDNQAAEVIRKYTTIVEQAQPSGLLVGNLGGVNIAKEYFNKLPLYGDYFLNVFNSQAMEYFAKEGLQQVALSPELTLKQLQQLAGAKVATELIVHGSLLMMTAEYCPVGSLLGGRVKNKNCSVPCTGKTFGLKDRIKEVFPMEQDQFCRSYIYNPKKLCMIDQVKELAKLKANSWRLELKTANSVEVQETIRLYKKEISLYYNDVSGFAGVSGEASKEELAKYSPKGFTRGHYYRGVLES
ncbi:MAG: DUF3656 domain-containing protein [Bacillota bacterium]|nr:DUF3656 domain-containing protein [Bacillota bacterium]